MDELEQRDLAACLSDNAFSEPHEETERIMTKKQTT